MKIRIGIPKEIKPGEFRVAALPKHVERLKQLGCEIVVQRHAGAGSGYGDDEYQQAGAQIVDGLSDIYAKADLIWKVKEILPDEYSFLRDRHILYTYLHAPPRPQMTHVLRDSKCIAIAYEEMVDDRGRRPLLMPMSRLAGAGAIAVAAQLCQSIHGGCGKLFFLTPGAEPVRVVILGAGAAGQAAARAALSAGAEVSIMEAKEAMLPELRKMFPTAQVVAWSAQAFDGLLPRMDVILNCTLWMPGDPHLVTRVTLQRMRKGTLIMDVSADPRGAIETSEETTHANPIRIVDGVLHYCVQNIPSLFARTSSQALSEVTWPFVEQICCEGLIKVISESAMLRSGVVAWRGNLFGSDLARSQGIKTLEPEELLVLLKKA